jgi:hypothetical protein
MTDEELRTLVGSLAVATTSNTEAIRGLRTTVENQSESIRELRISSENQAESIRELRTTVESQERVMTEGFARLTATAESQARSIESMRENISYNTDAMATALELAAISQRTAAASQVTASAALELSANTSRNLDRQEQETAELKQMIGILIRENQADRVRFGRLEGQN